MPSKKCPKLTKNDLESKFQTEVIKWLKKQGCEVFKMSPGAGIPDGTEDLLFLKDGFWGFLECKAAKDSDHQPGQDRAVERHNQMSYSRFVWPGERWEEIKKELGEMLK